MLNLPFNRDHLIEICRQNDVARIGGFGSIARGEFNEQSDIDLLIEFSKRKSLLALVALEWQISTALGRKVDAAISLTCAIGSSVTSESFMKPDESVYLSHILDAIAKSEKYLAAIDEKTFQQDTLIQDGVIRQIEIIGEATNRLSDELQSHYAHVPWEDIIDMRH